MARDVYKCHLHELTDDQMTYIIELAALQILQNEELDQA